MLSVGLYAVIILFLNCLRCTLAFLYRNVLLVYGKCTDLIGICHDLQTQLFIYTVARPRPIMQHRAGKRYNHVIKVKEVTCLIQVQNEPFRNMFCKAAFMWEVISFDLCIWQWGHLKRVYETKQLFSCAISHPCVKFYVSLNCFLVKAYHFNDVSKKLASD